MSAELSAICCCNSWMIYAAGPTHIINLLPSLNYYLALLHSSPERGSLGIVYRYNRTRIRVPQMMYEAAITCIANKQTTFTKCMYFLCGAAGENYVDLAKNEGAEFRAISPPVNHHLSAPFRNGFPVYSDTERSTWQWRLVPRWKRGLRYSWSLLWKAERVVGGLGLFSASLRT